jgi:outer membrane protein insertion porin family
MGVLAKAQIGINLGDDPEPSVNYSDPKEYELAEIEVSGTEFLDNNALISLSGLKIGDRIDIPGDDITNALKKLYGQGIIEDVRIYLIKVEEGKAYLNLEVKERPRLRTVQFNGINKSQQGELDDLIDPIRGKVVTDALVKNTERAIRNHFVEKGYLNTEVSVEQQQDTILRNSVSLMIDVERNSKVHINKIYINGNQNIADSKLKSKMKSTNEHIRFNLLEDWSRRLF